MANKIQIKRGLQANLPALDVGEIGFTTDQKRTYIGSAQGNIELAKASELAENAQDVKETKRHFLSPHFVEYIASFNKFGIGTPSGIANYSGGKYVVNITGTAGDSFVTVTSGTIAHGGGTWACVIQHDDLSTQMNRVTGISGNTFTLLQPLTKNVTGGKIGNLHDDPTGQHYTELGYYAYAQHLYNANPRYTERKKVLAQFLGSDVTGPWTISGVKTFNYIENVNNTDGTLRLAATPHLSVYTVDAAKYAEWQIELSEQRGYLETFVSTSTGQAVVEFYLDGTLVSSVNVGQLVERLTFPFEYAKTGKIKVKPVSGFPQSLRIGNTSWFASEPFGSEKIIRPSDKVVFIGDSWGEFHNMATTRELQRLMTLDGGTPEILNYSKGGHTTDYAREWFEEYVLANEPDVVVIEYFTNDFNSINGINLSPFTNPDGQPQDMNIASFSEYMANLRFMIDVAIENGIRPVVLLPAATAVINQAQRHANYAAQMFLGQKTLNDKPRFAEVTSDKTVTDLVESASATTSKPLVLMSKETNSSVRQGVVSDSNANLTNANIHTFKNNGVVKGAVKHDGTFEMSHLQLQRVTSSPTVNESNYGRVFLLNNAFTNNVDELRVIVKDGSGNLLAKKITLTDI